MPKELRTLVDIVVSNSMFIGHDHESRKKSYIYNHRKHNKQENLDHEANIWQKKIIIFKEQHDTNGFPALGNPAY